MKYFSTNKIMKAPQAIFLLPFCHYSIMNHQDIERILTIFLVANFLYTRIPIPRQTTFLFWTFNHHWVLEHNFSFMFIN